MKTTAVLLCALSFGCCGLGSCGTAPERVEMIAEGDTSFTVFCTSPPDCRKRAAKLCQAQGVGPLYDILEQLKGDELGEDRGIVIQCRK
jgi:hypothetical protein